MTSLSALFTEGKKMKHYTMIPFDGFYQSITNSLIDSIIERAEEREEETEE